SGYPLGTVLLFALFYILGLGNLDLATFLYTLFILGLSMLSSTVLLREFFDDQRSIFIGNIILLTVPTFFDFTYFTATARGSFIALAPLGLVWFLKTYKRPSWKMILVALPLPLALMLFHRMGMIYFIFLGLLLGFILFEKSIERLQHESLLPNLTELQKQKILTLLLLLAMLSTFIFAFFFTSSDYINVLSSSFFPSLPFIEYFIDFINLGFDYFLILGPAVLLFLYGISFFFFKRLSKEPSTISNFGLKFLFLLFSWPMLIVIKAPPYPRHLILPLMLPFVIDAWYNLEAKKRTIPLILVILTGCAVYFNVFDLLWRPIFPYNVIFTWIAFSVILISLLFNFLNQRLTLTVLKQANFPRDSQQFGLLLLILLLTLNSLILIEITSSLDIENSFPFSYTSEEEIQMAKILQNLVSTHLEQPILFFASHYLIEYRIAAYSGCLHLYDDYGLSLLAIGYHLAEDIINKSILRPIQEWYQKIHIFENSYTYEPLDFWYYILHEDFNSRYAKNKIETLNIKYFLELKNGNIAVSTWTKPFHSLFMETLNASVIAESQNLVLYQISE
ncbi:MAG: hypothetical protein ACFFBD_30460, partial [Candidatus Hodarchaeota archaeon]